MCRKADPVSRAPSHPSALARPRKKRPSGHFRRPRGYVPFYFSALARKKTVMGRSDPDGIGRNGIAQWTSTPSAGPSDNGSPEVVDSQLSASEIPLWRYEVHVLYGLP